MFRPTLDATTRATLHVRSCGLSRRAPAPHEDVERPRRWSFREDRHGRARGPPIKEAIVALPMFLQNWGAKAVLAWTPIASFVYFERIPQDGVIVVRLRLRR